MSTPSPGWYPDSQTGGQRYWDGHQWTNHRQPPTPPPLVAAPASVPLPTKKKSNKGEIIVGAVAVVVILAIAGTFSGNKGGDTSADNSSDSTSAADDAVASTKTTPAKKVKPKPEYTASQEEAMSAAKNYLHTGMGFSRAGLIQQLTSKMGSGFRRADAVFAVNHLRIDYNAQALEAAKNYKQTGMGFSRSGMIQQLTSKMGSQFTQAQAMYACNKLGLR